MRRLTGAVNLALLILVVITTLSGGLAFGVGTGPADAALAAVHGCSGLALLLLVPAKARIARRGLRRRGRWRKGTSLALAGVALLAVGSGVLHAVGGFRPYVGLLPMQLHVGAAVATLVLLGAHVWAHRRRARARRPRPPPRAARRRPRRRRGGAVARRPRPRASGHGLARGRVGRPRRHARDAVAVRPRAAARPGVLAAAAARRTARPRRARRPSAAHPARRARLHRRVVGRAGVARGRAGRAGGGVGQVDRGRVRHRLPPPLPGGATRTRCCWPRTWAGGRSRRGTAGRPGWSRRGGAGSGG